MIKQNSIVKQYNGFDQTYQQTREDENIKRTNKGKKQEVFWQRSTNIEDTQNRNNSSESANSNRSIAYQQQEPIITQPQGNNHQVPLQQNNSQIGKSKQYSECQGSRGQIDKKYLNDYVSKLQDLNKRMGSCPCFSMSLYFNNQIYRAVPILFIENIQEETDRSYISKRQDLQKLLICLLNEGGGFVFIGRKLKNSWETQQKGFFEEEKSTDEQGSSPDWLKQSVAVPKQMRLFYKTQIQKKKSFVRKVISQLASEIKSDSAFQIFIDQVKFKEYISNAQVGLKRNEFALRVKLVPKDKRKFFYLQNQIGFHQNIRFTFCRNLRGEMVFVGDRQMYELSHLIYKHGSANAFLSAKIWNHIDVNFVLSRIRQFTKFHENVSRQRYHEPDKEQRFTYLLLLRVGNERQSARRNKALRFLEEQGISSEEIFRQLVKGTIVLKIEQNMPMKRMANRMRQIHDKELAQVTKKVYVPFRDFEDLQIQVSKIKVTMSCLDCKVKEGRGQIYLEFKSKDEAILAYICLYSQNLSPIFQST